MTNTEAIEAVAKWLHDIDCRSAFHSGHPADIVCYDWMDEAKELVATIAPHMLRSPQIELLVSRGLPILDAETALTAYERTPIGEPYGTDAMRVAAILGSRPAIPAEAVEAAGEFLPTVWTSNEVYRARLIQALEAAAPHLLSHEREQARLAHLDAMVNRETKREELAKAWELGMVSMYASTGGEWPLIPEQNPYRPTP